ncbi:hypothetical protein ACFXK0_22775 [Nocardia sp. NPDC059177]|uniref:hypothetical protein n=1 Tax=Nocardia sp. NPDC059177 TaxID=3346759 RepID=UPI0036CFFEC2
MFQNLIEQLRSWDGQPRGSALAPSDSGERNTSIEVLTLTVESLQSQGAENAAGLLAVSWLQCLTVYPAVIPGGYATSVDLNLSAAISRLRRPGTPLPQSDSVPRVVRNAISVFAMGGSRGIGLETQSIAEDAFRCVAQNVKDRTAVRDCLSAWSFLRRALYAVTGDLMVLESAIKILQDACVPTASSASDPGPSARDLDALGTLLVELAELTHDADHLTESARFYNLALDLTTGAERRRVLEHLGAALHVRAYAERDPQRFSDAAQSYRSAISEAVPQSLEWESLVRHLLTVFGDMVKVVGAVPELDAVIDEATALIDGYQTRTPSMVPIEGIGRERSLMLAAGDEHTVPSLPPLHALLSELIDDRFELLRNPTDLDLRIRHLVHALDGYPRTERYWGSMVHDLGTAYGARFEFSADPSDLGRAVEYLTAAQDHVRGGAQALARANLAQVRARLKDIQ